jgi:CheY-like chemotaxis protein
LVARFLRVAGHEVVEAADGQEGVDRFLDSGPFDLALVDLNLPILCGIEVCRRILETLPDQPILICSAAIVAESEDSLRQLGVNQFLTKPYFPDALLRHIQERLANAPSRSMSRPTTAWT